MTVRSKLEDVDNSTFSRVLSIYTRTLDYMILSEESKPGYNVGEIWVDILDKLLYSKGGHSRNSAATGYFSYSINTSLFPDVRVSESWRAHESLTLLEYKSPDEQQCRGLILAADDGDDDKLNEFHDWFAKIVLRDSRLHLSYITNEFSYSREALTQTVADFFSDHLLNATEHDQWTQKGRAHFISKLDYFTRRNVRIEAVLPAFPCKSSNLEKVTGTLPDRGEEVALRRLMNFNRDIKSVYPQGMKLWIVSDGHVFSDCIGVDDDVVDVYTSELKGLYTRVAQSMQALDEDLIGFVSLKDIFFGKGLGFTPSLVEDVELPHYTGTKICEDSELSRRMLMASCDSDAGKLRKDITTDDHPRLHLYRGFSRFMCEDLELNSFCKTLSKNAFKKTVSRVAFEMIKRNDAYSNLVELVFPHHMRLSIHAHNNGGPKFGIKIIKPEACRVIKTLDCGESPDFEDLLHIPTPWHNCMVKVEGSDVYYMTKSKVVTNAISSKAYAGEWKPGHFSKGQGGYYLLSKQS